MNHDAEQVQLRKRIREFVDWKLYGMIVVVSDTSNFMNIDRGNIVRLHGEDYLIRGDMYEPRFGLQDQPKFWVKRAIDLSDGSDKILKLVFHEKFVSHIGPLSVPCYRDPIKEANVLDLVSDDRRFMHGFSVNDDADNNIRIIDFIKGKTLYQHILELELPHEEYFHTEVPGILQNLVGCFQAIQFLHDNELNHGDIRNDHIIIEKGTGAFRWIDFDLTQDYSDFDIWGLGNIVNFVIGLGIRSFQEVYHTDIYSQKVKESLTPDDASAFFKYRVMNLQKLFPYIPDQLNNVLMHYTLGAEEFYQTIDELINDLEAAINVMPTTATG